ncbi:MAG: hypothetical protein QM758_02245 [Armatimonas sp.]
MFTTLNKIWSKLRPGNDVEGGPTLAVLLGTDADALTLRLAELHSPTSNVETVRLLPVPRDEDMPTEIAQEALIEAERKRLGRAAGKLKVTPVRNPCAYLNEHLGEHPATLIISAPLPTEDKIEAILGRVLKDAPGDILIARLPSVEGLNNIFQNAQVVIPVAKEEAPSAALLGWAAQLGHQGAQIFLAGFLEVPRSLPNEAAIPPDEQALEAILAKAQATLKSLGVECQTKIKRGRELSEELLRSCCGENRRILLLSESQMELVPELGIRATSPLLICRSGRG